MPRELRIWGCVSALNPELKPQTPAAIIIIIITIIIITLTSIVIISIVIITPIICSMLQPNKNTYMKLNVLETSFNTGSNMCVRTNSYFVIRQLISQAASDKLSTTVSQHLQSCAVSAIYVACMPAEAINRALSLYNPARYSGTIATPTATVTCHWAHTPVPAPQHN